jgi:tetratricopeptide (TPR) repeat protein
LSLKLITIDRNFARAFLVAAALAAAAIGWYFVKWNFANAVSSRLDSQRAESKAVSLWLTWLAPDDPQTHFAAAVTLEKTFDPGDLDRSLAEYEMAAALSPNNYLMWLSLGRSRSLNGDIEGSASAFRRALELAPNYASVQWADGNSMIRQGQIGEGLSLMANAAALDPTYSLPAATTALQIFEGDVGRSRSALGDGDAINASLAVALAAVSRFDDAFQAWTKIAAALRTSTYQKLGESLAAQMMAAGRFRLAALIWGDLWADVAEKPAVGAMSNGGFESGVKLAGASRFEWSIAEGSEPQIGLSDTQKHSGNYGLLVRFNTVQNSGFRPIAQTVAVDPGTQYELELYYLSDVRGAAALKWEIADAATTVVIASTPPLTSAAEWASVRVRFAAPATVDGVIVRFNRDGCGGPACPMSGRIVFDDLVLRRL